MNKSIAFLIRGMGITGALLVLSIPFFFNPPISTTLKVVSLGLLMIFIIFAASAIRLRKRMEDE
ncbi:MULTISPECIES: hypothetical protein [unclassified Exiguobacterium]|jgi:amino acid transporter|uniref:hypothetical protein n=1 Tax=unclassified Exiguobacterium TaxID=2644629 RepID=UPI001BE72786|nr:MULTISPECIES: hypothetical protein [unclassified Exiguobacterium]MDE0564730.1 hypothetical protein [Exiguobacterium sp. B2(2022)]